MAFPQTTIVDLVLFLLWQALSQPVYQCPLFKEIFFSEEYLREVFQTANLSFVDDLYKIINARTPPSVKWFRRLPDGDELPTKKLWGVYILVLVKDGKYAVYVGSGTNSRDGVHHRWLDYNGGKYGRFGVYLDRAVKSGYEIVHKGLLVWAPIPAAKDIPKVRLLILALEAMFGFLFWTMCSETKDYGIGACCPWDRKLFTYTGLCNHSALLERPRGDFELSPEELEAIAAASKQRQREMASAYHKQWRLDKMAEDPEAYRASRNADLVRDRAANPEKHKKKAHEKDDRNRNQKNHYCETCERAFSCKRDLETHIQRSEHHKERVAMAARGETFVHFCRPCGYGTNKTYKMTVHKRTKMHKKNLTRLAAKAAADKAAAAERATANHATANTATANQAPADMATMIKATANQSTANQGASPSRVLAN